jgi:hypothetical protein
LEHGGAMLIPSDVAGPGVRLSKPVG